MANWIGIVLALLVIVAGASWQAYRLAGAARTRGRTSLRARRAAQWRRRREEADALNDEPDDGR